MTKKEVRFYEVNLLNVTRKLKSPALPDTVLVNNPTDSSTIMVEGHPYDRIWSEESLPLYEARRAPVKSPSPF